MLKQALASANPDTYRKPSLKRLHIALVAAQKMAISRWLFDGMVFKTHSEGGTVYIGNVPGFIAKESGVFTLQPLVAGVALRTTPMVALSMANASTMPLGMPQDIRWRASTVCYRDGRQEYFGWHAVCEYFNLGMWDARRIFSGYGMPAPATLQSTTAFLERFIANRT